jgi:hypothetical protein
MTKPFPVSDAPDDWPDNDNTHGPCHAPCCDYRDDDEALTRPEQAMLCPERGTETVWFRGILLCYCRRHLGAFAVAVADGRIDTRDVQGMGLSLESEAML